MAVLCGSNGTFCAGADLHRVAETWEQWNLTEDGQQGPLGPSRLLLSKPVIAAVAGGLELALWCDMRVVEQSATFGVFCRRWGVPLIDGGTVRLPRLIGHSRALDMILTGRPVGAEEALHWGLANRVVADGTARAAAEALAAQIASPSCACVPIACRATNSGACRRLRPFSTSSATAAACSKAARRWRAPRSSATEKGATAVSTEPRPHGQ